MSTPGWDEPTKKLVSPSRPPPADAARRAPLIKKIEFEDPVEEETLRQKVQRLEMELAEANRGLNAAWEIIRSRDNDIENLQAQMGGV